MALTYNDKSILENHHCATGFRILEDEKTNILADLRKSPAKWVEFRKIVIAAILATDVQQHFAHLAKFKAKLDNNELRLGQDQQNPEDFLLTIGVMVHTADLYVPTKNLGQAQKWSGRVNDEFAAQLVEEQRLGLPETPFYKGLDDPSVVARSEKFFVEKIVTPLWVEWDRFLNGSLKVHRENLANTQKYWNELSDKLEKAKQGEISCPKP